MSVAITPLGYGGASVGNLHREVSDDRAARVLETAWECGIRYFDTAPHYGLGLSERRLGEFLRTRPRDQYVISTKAGRLLIPNPAFAGGTDLRNGFAVPDDRMRLFDPSPSGIRRSLEESLQRLGLDRVDILLLHDPDVYDLERGLREGLPSLVALREEGLVSRVGVGVNDAAVAASALREADIDVVMIAGRYTLLEQPAAEDLLPLASSRGTRIVAAAPFNSGLLSRAHVGDRYNYADAPAELVARARAIADLCEQFGVDLPTAALHFPLRHPAVDSVVVGTDDPHAVRENARRLAAPVPDALWEALASEGFIPSTTSVVSR
ncbi:aldo/keto reductase [Microbacterium sp. F51-2R]|uniref:aldo/keto reductase n=1 Tax=Microbacterium sp. F51-2R TaxID=3445777 RepID=UPI003FA07262